MSYLGRPLSRTIILDTNPLHVQLQPSNAILLPPWLGSASPPSAAKDLVALIPFLEAIAIKGVQDVRSVIDYYGGEDVARKYALAEEKEKGALKERWEREKEGGGGVIRGLLGGLIKVGSTSVSYLFIFDFHKASTFEPTGVLLLIFH